MWEIPSYAAELLALAQASAKLMRGSIGGRSKKTSARKQKADRHLAAKIMERYGAFMSRVLTHSGGPRGC